MKTIYHNSPDTIKHGNNVQNTWELYAQTENLLKPVLSQAIPRILDIPAPDPQVSASLKWFEPPLRVLTDGQVLGEYLPSHIPTFRDRTPAWQPTGGLRPAARYSHFYELLWAWQQWFWPPPFACPAACQNPHIFATAGTEPTCVSPLLQHHVLHLDLKCPLPAAPVHWLGYQGWISRKGTEGGQGRK